MDKKNLRNKIARLRDQLPENKRELFSQLIVQKVLNYSLYKETKTVLYFVSFKSEVNTFPLIQDGLERGKRVILPITDIKEKRLIFSEIKDIERELRQSTYGILEPRPECIRPVKAEEIDFVLTPGLVFDRRGYRIGYGGGFYDRFLGQLSKKPHLLAIAFDMQIVDFDIPADPHDIPVDVIITEKRIIECKEKIDREG